MYLELSGEVFMGVAPSIQLQTGQCMLIHTGGMLPAGADAVIMLEYTQVIKHDQDSVYPRGRTPSSFNGDVVELFRAVAVGENVLLIGEDVAQGHEVIPAGTCLRPADIGGLMALGITSLPVVRRPKVGIISSGDEVVPPDVEPNPGQVRDVNSYTLQALIDQTGGEAVLYGVVPDQPEVLSSVARQLLEQCDLLAITAGSSASTRDFTADVIHLLGEPGVLVHGVNIRPGKPTILAVCDGKPVIGLPGNPVSALVIAWLFLVPVIRSMLGIRQIHFRPVVSARLTVNLASQAGREDWIPVKLSIGEDGFRAEPVFGKSNLIFTLSRADGLVCIPTDATGIEADEMIQVYLL
jgi:molybdopterin molybdotransferase